jgi:hypothetical protein
METNEISDMYLAAAFLSYDVELISIDRSNKRRQRFCFGQDIDHIWIMDGGMAVKVNSPSVDDVKTKFTANTLLYPPSYPAAIRRIKSAIHDPDNE